MENRVVALSVLEDLLFWPLPPRDGVVAAPDDFDSLDYMDEDELAIARLASEENSLEPRAVREARYRAVLQLPLLCAKLGPRWTRAEVVPYLLRCLEEEDAPLSFSVAVVLLGLVRPHATTDSERDRLAKDRAVTAKQSGSPDPTASATTPSTPSTPSTQAATEVDDSRYAFLTLEDVMPVVERLGACREERLRAFVAQVVVPHVCFGVPLEQGSVMEGWDRKFLLPVHMMQSLEDQQAGAVGGGGEEDDDATGDLAAAAAAATVESAAAGTSSAASHGARAKPIGASSVRRAAASGMVDPRQRVLRQLRDVMDQYRQRAISRDTSDQAVPWTPLDYVYQRLDVCGGGWSGASAAPVAGHRPSHDASTAERSIGDEGVHQILFALEAVKMDNATDTHLSFVTPYLDRLADAGVLGSLSHTESRHAASSSAAAAGKGGKGGKHSLLLLRYAPLDMLGISYAADGFGSNDGGPSASSDGGAATDPFTLNVRARALTSDVARWFDLITTTNSDNPDSSRRQILATDYLDGPVAVRTVLVSRWHVLQTLLQRLLCSSFPGAVAVGVAATAGLIHALTHALDFARRNVSRAAATTKSESVSSSHASDVLVVAPPPIPLRFNHDAQVFHLLTTNLHLAFCVTAVYESGEMDAATTSPPKRTTAHNVWQRVAAALPVAINSLYARLYAHRVFLLTPVQMLTRKAASSPTPLSADATTAEWEWLVQLGPGPLEARMPMLATWDVAFASNTRTGQPDDIAVLLVRDDDDDDGRDNNSTAGDREGSTGTRRSLQSRLRVRPTHTNTNSHTDDGAADSATIAVSGEATAGWRRGVAGIASAFRLHHVLRLGLLQCLPTLITLEPCFGVGPAELGMRAEEDGGSQPRPGRASSITDAEATPAATLDTVVRLLAQVIAPPAALPQLLSELLVTSAVLNGVLTVSGDAIAEDSARTGGPRDELSQRGGAGSPSARARAAAGMHRSRRGSCFSPTSQLLGDLPHTSPLTASPRGPNAPGELPTDAVPPSLAALLASPVEALQLGSDKATVTARVGESPASVDYAILEVVVASVEKTLTSSARLLMTELASYTDAVVAGRLAASATVTAVAQRVAAVVRLLFLLYQSCVRYIMVRSSWKARWLLSKRLPTLTAGFLYVLVSLAHEVSTPPLAQPRHNTTTTSPATQAAMTALRDSLQSVVVHYFGFTCDLLTKAWSAPSTGGEPGVLFTLLSDDEAEVCYLSTHCLSSVFEELGQAAFRIAAAMARRAGCLRRAHNNNNNNTHAAAVPAREAGTATSTRSADHAENELCRAEFAKALAPLLRQLRGVREVVVQGCRLNLADPLPRVRCGAVKGLALLSGVLSSLVVVARFYEPYDSSSQAAPDDTKKKTNDKDEGDDEHDERKLMQQPWADALTRTTQTLLSAMNDTSSVVQLTLVSELSHLLIHEGSDPSSSSSYGAAGNGDGGDGGEASRNVRYEALLRCLKGLARHDIWRYRERYAVLLAEMCFCFLTSASPSLQKLVKDTLLQLLVNALFDKVKAVRDAALAATVKLCARLYAIAVAGNVAATADANDFVNGTLWPIIYETPQAWDTYLSRNALLQVALCLGVEKKGTMLPLLQKLAKDPVLNVRLVVAKTILQILISDRASSAHTGDGSAMKLASTSSSSIAPSSSQTRAEREAAPLQPSGATTYELLMGKPSLFNTIRRIRPASDGPRRPTSASTTRTSASGGAGEADGDLAPGLALPLITFTTEEKNGVVLTLLRELLEDPTGDVRDEAAKALHICF